jgi:hypothetical protein
MFLLYFINYFQQSISSSLGPYITSDFEAHSLVPLIGVISSVMGAATYMPLSKILNMFDRWVGFALMVALATLGLIMTASCDSIGTYCAATVWYTWTHFRDTPILTAPYSRSSTVLATLA